MTYWLRTKSQCWSENAPKDPQPWTDRGINGFYAEFGPDEKLPLISHGDLACTGHGVNVHHFTCTNIGKEVAIKRMETASNEATIGRLNREVDVLRSVYHYHCIRPLGSYTWQDTLGIITEPVAECDLYHYLFAENSFKTHRMLQSYGPRSEYLPKLMGCLAYGLQYIHREKGETTSQGAQTRHRDIKPSNILLLGHRVLYADFGISKIYTETQTGTSGESHDMTAMYASPERLDGQYRNRKCDIFSLGCVFADMFTVIKGGSAEAFRRHRISYDKERRGYFSTTTNVVFRWLDRFAQERCDVQIIRLIRTMLRPKYEERPSAEQVWKTLTACTSETRSGSNPYFCGPCCMPLHKDDPLLHSQPGIDPAQTNYVLPESAQNTGPLPADMEFKKEYGEGGGPGLSWKRNLRYWDHATLDVVQLESSLNLDARKRVFLPGNIYGADRANNEAEILREVQHRHIIALHSTYRHPDIMTLHFEPAADMDLRTFLELTELRMIRTHDISMDKQLQEDLNLLTECFGCMARALSTVHAAGYDHGELRPENILVHKRRMFISKFSLGLRHDRNIGDNWYHRFTTNLGALSLGNRNNQLGKETVPPKPNVDVMLYKPPEWDTQPSEVGQPASDVFSLGCVFLEIYRVLTRGRVRLFEYQRADKGNWVYRDTLEKTKRLVATFENDSYHTKNRFVETLLCMIDPDPGKRPTAKEVHLTMAECRNSEGHPRCGPCRSCSST